MSAAQPPRDTTTGADTTTGPAPAPDTDAPESSAPLLDLARVSHHFGGFQAVDDMSLSVGAGEVVGLLGANGAGKTTLIRIALGLLAPTSGRSTLLGRPPDRQVRRRVGYVPQGLGLYADLSVRENLDFVADVYGRPRPELPTGLTGLAADPVGRISLGNQRELAFACALLHEPELLVLDEPTSGVGALAGRDLWATIHGRAGAGVGVLVTTHNMQEAQQCDRLVLMSSGRLVGQGSEAQVVAGTSAVLVETGDWARAFDILTKAGMPVALAGTAVRVAGVEAALVRSALIDAGLSGQVRDVPATLEERMTLLAGQADPR